MLHSIITILTTTAVALHAMLGCCAHHEHSCVSHESAPVVEVDEGDHRCSHAHKHQNADDSASRDVAENCGHQHDSDQPHRCEEADCDFTAIQQSDDLELLLTFSMWCQTPVDSANADASIGRLSLQSVAELPPDPLTKSGSARAITQVWRL